MDRFHQFWTRFCADLPDAPTAYVYRHHTLLEYPREAPIKLPHDPFPYYCVVLAGLVGGYQADHAGRPVLRDLVLPMDFFTGTEHPFTQRTKTIEYRALAKTAFMRLPIKRASEGQSRHREIAELFHVMKQRKIDQLRKLVAIYQEADYYARYCVYRQALPAYAQALPHRVQEQLLRMSHASYQRVKARYLRAGK